jgi:hypothetical protein
VGCTDLRAKARDSVKRPRTAGSRDIAKEILAYLAEHPRAEDTLEGIVQWWLLEREIQRGTTEVQTALAMLTAQALVLEKRGPDARIRYCINRRRLREIRAQLT